MMGEGVAHRMGVERVHIAALIARMEGPDKIKASRQEPIGVTVAEEMTVRALGNRA